MFVNMKGEAEKSVVRSIDDEAVPFVVETDASDVALAVTLTQAGRPVAFFFRTLNTSEQKYAAVEKEAHAIHLPSPIERLDVENRLHSRHFLARTQVYVPDRHDKTTVFIYLVVVVVVIPPGTAAAARQPEAPCVACSRGPRQPRLCRPSAA